MINGFRFDFAFQRNKSLYASLTMGMFLELKNTT